MTSTAWSRAWLGSTATSSRPGRGSHGRHARTTGWGWAMQTNTDGRLEQALAALDDLRSLVRERGFSQSELFLDMAKLQLQLDLNGITDHEFNAFCDAVERGGVIPGPADRARPGQARQRRNGE